MSSLIRFEPWAMHRELLSDFNRFIERSAEQDGSSSATADWTPTVDIHEHSDKYVIYADVPGVDPAGIEITLEQGLLTLSGSRERNVEQAGIQSSRAERVTGRFFRRFALPDTIDVDSVSARGTNGVLEVVIPKSQTAQPRRITVADH